MTILIFTYFINNKRIKTQLQKHTNLLEFVK